MHRLEDLEPAIERVVDGDLDAFAMIVRVYQRPVRAWIASRCPPGADVDDVAQRTFVAVFDRMGDFEVGTDFRAWLFAIARFQLMAECTRLQRLADYHSRYAPHALSLELHRRADEALQESDRLAHLRGCLERFDRSHREIIDWRYAHELPLAEIAQRANRSVGAIKKHLFVLRQKLHECIERKLAEEAT